MKDKLIVILGPTAVGKTDLSIELAKKFKTEIISGDSMLVYRGFDIGSAKPSLKERQGIKHHLIDILDPAQNFAVTDFVVRAKKIIHELNEQGKIPVLAGGTGLYIKALLEGYEFNVTEEHTEYREYLAKLGAQYGKAYVHAMLAKVNPEAAARLHVNDFRRVIRALEVAHFGAEKISQQKSGSDAESLIYKAYVIGLNRERKSLYTRINQRVEMMFDAGLVTEVSDLLKSGVTRAMPAMKGIGYKETAAFIAGEMTKMAALELIQKSTRHFAKRQLTWYRKMPYIHWYMADELSAAELLATASHDIAGFFTEHGE